MKDRSCAIVASPTMKFPWGYDEEDERCKLLKRRVRQEILSYIHNGINHFVVAVDRGFGLYAAEIISDLREYNDAGIMFSAFSEETKVSFEAKLSNSKIELHCCLPFEEQSTKWTPALRERYFQVLRCCTDAHYINRHYTKNCRRKAKYAAIDLASRALIIISERGSDPFLSSLEKYMKNKRIDVNFLYPQNDFD